MSGTSSQGDDLRRPLIVSVNDDPRIIAASPMSSSSTSAPSYYLPITPSSATSTPSPSLSSPATSSPGQLVPSPSLSSYAAPLLSSSPVPVLPLAPHFTRQLSESTAKKLAQGNFFRQLPAMLHKNWLLKARYPASFLMELLSPLVILMILVLGWWLSHESLEVVQAQVYANDTAIVNDIINDVTVVPSSATNSTQCYHTRSLPPNTAFCFEGSDVDVLNAVLNYDGPTSIPSIDEYIGLHRAILQSISNASSPSQSVDAIDSLTDHQLTNLIYLGTLAFSPNTTAVRSLLHHLNTTNLLFGTVDVRVFDSEAAAVDGAMGKQRYWAVVHFNELDLAGGQVDFVIRMNYTVLPSTSTTISKFQLGLDDSYKRYMYSGFLTLQTMIDTAVLYIAAQDDYSQYPPGPVLPPPVSNDHQRPHSSLSPGLRGPPASPILPPNNSVLVTSVNITTVPMPTPGYQGSSFYSNIGPLISLVMAMCMLFPVSRLIKGIVEEKESKTKETMKMMGLLDSVFVASWFISSLLQFTLIALMITVLMHFTLFPHTDLTLLFVFFFTFILSEITFSFLISVFFSSAKLAGIVGSILIFAAVIPRYAYFNTDPNEAILGKTLVSLLSPTAFTLGADVLLNYEGVNVGLTWGGIEDDSFSLFRVLLLMLFDTCLYGWLAWYLEHVLPSQYSPQPLPFYFCLLPSFWLKSWFEPSHEHADDSANSDCDPRLVEPVPSTLAGFAAVHISQLRRVFSEGRGSSKRTTVAVHGLNLTFYEGQITALLGHNGAGKTTTISMLTGLITPSSGDCLMYGNSIREDMSLIRKSLGVCSQQDVLFDRLTVKEHLTLYANLKGVDKPLMDEEVGRYIAQCGLADKVDAWAGSLSGGQKRKLCVALALVGGSRIIFLDEPTSGMDPYSRRSTWDLLRLNKEGRVMIFTTHYMDEADLLADRIAIMADGKLRCCGSSLFLKNQLGGGYTLTVTRASHRWNPTDITRLMLRCTPQAHLVSAAGGELSYRMSLGCVSSFPTLFKELDRKKGKLGIGGYGISMTTLEEVFMRITHKADGEEEDSDDDTSVKDEGKESSPSHLSPPLASVHEVSVSSAASSRRRPSFLMPDDSDGYVLEEVFSRTRQSVKTSTQLWELFRKRYICALRDLSGKFYEVCLPVLVVGLVLLIIKINVNPAGPEIVLNSSLYTQVQTDAALTFDMKDTTSTSHYVYTRAMPELENGTFFFLAHRPAISMRESPYSTSLNVSQYDLLPTIKAHTGARYGGLVLNDTLYTRFNWSSGKIADNDVAVPSPLTFLHNASFIHALPVLAAELQQARYAANRYWHGRGRNESTGQTAGVKYVVRNFPLPATSRDTLRMQTYLTLFAALFVMIPFCYLPASFVLFVVKERTCKSKHLQMVSGVHANLYWTSAYLWDSLNYLGVCVAVMGTFLAYESQAFVGSVESFFATFLLLLLYGLACTPLSYVYSFLFHDFTSAQVGIVGLHFLTGFGLIITDFILDNVGNFQQANLTFKPFYRLFPPFNLAEGLIELSKRDLTYLSTSIRPPAFGWEVVGRNLTCLSAEVIVYFALTLFIEHGTFYVLLSQMARRQSSGVEVDIRQVQEDEDVLRERKRVEDGISDERRHASPSPPPPMSATDSPHDVTSSPPQARRPRLRPSSPVTVREGGNGRPIRSTLSVPGDGDEGGPRRKWSSDSMDSVASRMSDEAESSEDVIRMQHLRKVWSRVGAEPSVAVADLSLGIPRGVCFGFLGINGAGKTSTLKLLTGDELPTSGTASINGFDVVTQSSFVQRERGYCPQTDPLLEMLTGREQLGLYARLRGIPRRFINEVVWHLLDKLGLGGICDRRCGSYSGGNKRKLSLAIALIGEPSVLFLDEPSCGMDPVSRRFTWSVISAVADSRTVILTSHSMEEVEALCNLIGIMVKGRLRCLGSIQHLKTRFGNFYHLDVNTRETHTHRVKKYIEEVFHGAVLEEEHACRLKYGLPKTGLSLGHAFGSIEKVKDSLGITEYSLSQSSLEQIFLSTVRKAEEEEMAEHRAEGSGS